MATDPLQAIRDIALAFPEAEERETWGQATFRVRGKIFVTHGTDDQGRDVVTTKAPPGEQEQLLATDDERFFPPKYLASKGWIGVRIDDATDWREIAELVVDSYREIAPRPLAAGIGLAPAGPSRAARAVVGVGNVIGELVEGKPPREQTVAEDVADDDLDDGPRLDFDPDDPSSTSIEL